MTARMGLNRVEAHWLVTEEQNKNNFYLPKTLVNYLFRDIIKVSRKISRWKFIRREKMNKNRDKVQGKYLRN